MSSIRGLEILFAVSRKKLKSRADCAVAALHCIMTNSGLLCVGLGEDFSDNDSDSMTELIPENWNENQEVYYLRYQSEDLKNCYLLKIIKADGHLHVNLVLNKEKSYSMMINLDDHVSENFSEFFQTFKKLDQLDKNFQQAILNNLKKSKSDTVSTNNMTPVGPTQVGIPGTSRQGELPPSTKTVVWENDPYLWNRGQEDMRSAPLICKSLTASFEAMAAGLPINAIIRRPRFDPFTQIVPDTHNPDPNFLRSPDYDNMFL